MEIIIGNDFSTIDNVIIRYNEKLRISHQEDTVALFINYYKKYLSIKKISQFIINRITRETIKVELCDRIIIGARINTDEYKYGYSINDLRTIEELNNEITNADWSYFISIEKDHRTRSIIKRIVQSVGEFNNGSTS